MEDSLEGLSGERVLVMVEALVPSEMEDYLQWREEVVFSRVVLRLSVNHHHPMKFVLEPFLVVHVSVIDSLAC